VKHRTVRGVSLAAAVTAALVAAMAAVAEGQAARSVWDGVYTTEQADRGQALYTANCASCHAETLGGGETAPALTGVAFNATWDGVALSGLFERMRLTMPPGKTGTLSREQHADILAHLLRASQFPTGQDALSADRTTLENIRFETYRPR
jgi:mono/diheme cytochrome c family protein